MASASSHPVEIYLPVGGAQIPFLSIPQNDIQRLSIRPFKWLRFVMFSICGARGDLSVTPNGPPVRYESTLLDGDRYYYKPSDEFAFVDPHGLNDRLTSTAQTPRRHNLREEVMQRDGQFCVITGDRGVDCDAAHLIPRRKGDEYLERVIEIRAQRYDPRTPSISSIDAVENAILLRKDVHSKLGRGAVTFLKTPNFAMDSIDIPRIERGPHTDQITLHQFEDLSYDPDQAQHLLAQAASGSPLKPGVAYSLGLHVDALFLGTANVQDLPPAIILDFTYGVAAYNRWTNESFHSAVEDFFAEHYISIPPRASNPPSISGGDETDSTDDSGSNYRPPSRAMQKKVTEKHVSNRGSVLADAMDRMNRAMMFLSDITPQEAAKIREKRIEEEELMAREASRTKVMEWRKTVSCLHGSGSPSAASVGSRLVR